MPDSEIPNSKSLEPATLVLADGKIFNGFSVGAKGETSGEVVFNTSMSGYQEIITDPSYAGQMITFTYPHIGNVGVNNEDVESSKVHVSGLIVKDMCFAPSNFRSQKSLPEYLLENNIVAISGIDTRELVLHLRTHGAQMGIIKTGALDSLGLQDLLEKVKNIPSIEGQDLVPLVTCKEPYDWTQGAWVAGIGYKQYSDSELNERPFIVAIDFGVKFNILRLLLDAGFRVKVVPANTTSEEILSLRPDGVFLSNGPGDPAAVTYGIETVRNLLGKVPMFGICLGHQILGLALGAPTFKLKFGHRGGNHPVKNIKTGAVEISVQNHGFATDASSIPDGVTLTHTNLNDSTIEGLEVSKLGVFSVQYHPECSPGPHDSSYLFNEFYNRVSSYVK